MRESILSKMFPFIAICLAGTLPLAAAAEPDPVELIRKAERVHKIAEEEITASMFLQKKKAQPIVRQLRWLISNSDDKKDNILVEFTAPADIKGTTLLTVGGEADEDDAQWMYLPAYKKTRRLGSGELGDRFVGSDYTYEDLRARRTDDYVYKLLKTDTIDGEEFYVIESTPHATKLLAETAYGKSEIWLHTEHLYSARVRLYDKRKRPFKEITSNGWKKLTDTAWRPSEVTVVDKRRNHRTVLKISNRRLDFGIPADTFNAHRLGGSGAQ